MARERCDVCRRRIRRADEDTAQYWFGQAGDDGMARLMVTHVGCEEKVTPDMRASVREKALLVANTLGRVRGDRSEEATVDLMIVAVGMGGGEELFAAFQESSRSRTTTSSPSRSSRCCPWPASSFMTESWAATWSSAGKESTPTDLLTAN
jgi:hypothetical protein